MADNTLQGGVDLMSSDELTTINGGAAAGEKVQRVKPGYGADGDLTDVSVNNGLPVDSSESVITVVTLNSASPSAAIDTTGFSWISVQVGAGYTTETALVMQASNDQVTWFSVALSPVASTSSGITTSLGITTNLFHGPIPARFIRFAPTGTYTSGSQVLTLYMQALPGQLNTAGSNASAAITSFSTSVAPAISNAVLTIGTATGNGFQVETNSSADRAAAAFVPAVSTQIAYITDIYWSIWGTGINTPRLIALIANATALGRHDILAHPSSGLAIVANNGVSGERHFRQPWKTSSAVNVAVNLAVTSQGAAVGNWQVVVEGFYQSS